VLTCWSESPGSNSAIIVRLYHPKSDGRPKVKSNDVVGIHILRKCQLEGLTKRDVLTQNRVINQLFGVAA
jgi:hypothetical protein